MKIKNKNTMRSAALSLFIALFLLLAGQGAMGQAVGDYRAKASGNWSALTTWERCNSLSPATWAQPTVGQGYPGQFAGNTHYVTIAANGATVYNVTLDLSIPNVFDSLAVQGSSNTSRSTLSVGTNVTLNTGQVTLTTYGQLVWTANCDLTLPADAKFFVLNNGQVSTSGPCNNNRVLIIGTTRYAGCVGGGNVVYTFADINNSGGVLSITASGTPAYQCWTGNPLSFTLNYTPGGLGYNTSTTTYTWSLSSGPVGYSFTDVVQSYSTIAPVTVNLTLAGTYIFWMTAKQYVGGVLYYTTHSAVTLIVEKPNATISGSTSICTGSSAPLSVALTGNYPPWSFTYTDGTTPVTITNVATSPYTLTVSPTSTKTYTLTSVSDANCSGYSPSGTTSAIVTVNPSPQGSISGETICTGGNGYLTWTATTGANNYTIVVNDGTSNITKTGVVSGTPFQIATGLTTNKTYSLISVTDGNGCQRTSGFTGSSAQILVTSSGVWTGATNTDWFTASNWCGGVPTSSQDVFINLTANQPHITGNGAVCNNISIGSGASLSFDGAYTLGVYGNWSNSGTLSPGIGTVSFTGTAAQTYSSSASMPFYNMVMNNSAGLTLSTDATVTNSLTLTNGEIATGNYYLILGSPGNAGSLSRSLGQVNGNMRRYIPNTTNPSVSFPVGVGSYTNLVVDFVGTTTGSGYFDVSNSVLTGAPAVASGISQTKYVNRSWSIANGGVGGFTSFSPTFYFLSANLIGGANPSTFIASRYDGTYHSTVAGTRTSTSTQATGVIGFGTFFVGESGITCVIINQGTYSRPLR